MLKWCYVWVSDNEWVNEGESVTSSNKPSESFLVANKAYKSTESIVCVDSFGHLFITCVE